MEEKKPFSIGLALSGGGSYAIFQLGVIDVLHEKKKPGFILDKQVKAISGTSGGAINAVFLSKDNMDTKRLHEFWIENNLTSFREFDSSFLKFHFARLKQMELREKELNDVDESYILNEMPYNDFFNDLGLIFVKSVNFDNSEIGRKIIDQVKFLEKANTVMFPFMQYVNQIPKNDAQKSVRIFLRELLVRHLLPEDKAGNKTSCFERIKTMEDVHFPISVFIGASNIKDSTSHIFIELALRSGKYAWNFSGEQYRYGISIESMLCCANIPGVFPAKRLYSYPLFESIGYDKEANKLFYKEKFTHKGHWATLNDKGEEIDGKTAGIYWDGYFLNNPSLEPLVRLNCCEILLIRLAGVTDDSIPVHESDIENRKETLIQNVSIQRDIRQIRMHNEHLEKIRQYNIPEFSDKRFIRVHEIRFDKKNIIDQAIVDPIKTTEYIELGQIAGTHFKRAYKEMDKIIEKNNLNLSSEYAEIVITCNYEKKTFNLFLRDCIGENEYHICNYCD